MRKTNILTLLSLLITISFTVSSILLIALLYLNTSFIDSPIHAILLFVAVPFISSLLLTLLLYPFCRAFNLWRGVNPFIKPLWITSSLIFLLIFAGYTYNRISLSFEEKVPLKILLFGIDGATFDIIGPMIEAGELTTIAGGIRDGSSGILHSLEPMLSPIVWTDIATGVRPEKHGIKGFHMSAEDLAYPRFWDILEYRKGYRIGIYKWLVTYPPREANGFIIPAWLARGIETTPAELSFIKEPEIKVSRKKGRFAGILSISSAYMRGIEYGLSVRSMTKLIILASEILLKTISNDEKFIRTGLLRAEIDSIYFRNLVRRFKPDIATFTIYETDALGHRFWKYMQPLGRKGIEGEIKDRGVRLYGEVVRDAYRLSDRILKEILDVVEPEYLFILSDHGFRAAEGEEGKFLLIKSGTIQRFLDKAGIRGKVYRVGKMAQISLDGGEKSEVEEAISILGQVLTSDGLPFFSISEPSPKVLGLKITDEGYRSVKRKEEIIFSGTRIKSEEIAVFDEEFSGVHAPEGIIIVKGRGIKSGYKHISASLLDVAPTILHISGLPIPEDMDGRVMDDIFVKKIEIDRCESYLPILKSLSLRKAKVEEEKEKERRERELHERLKALGYVE